MTETQRAALVAAADFIQSDGAELEMDEAKRIAEVLRTLAAPVQEPVAWVYEFYADMGHKGLAFEEQPSAHNTPLYTAPPPRKPEPLTEEEIYAAIKDVDSLKAVEVARAVEAAHGITGEQK